MRVLAISILAIITIIDWQRHEIWHGITIPSICLAIFAAPWLPADFIANALLGALVAFTLFWIIWFIGRRVYGTGALGFGDVMLAALLGALGGVVDGLLWLAVGMLLAGSYAIWLRYILKSPIKLIAYGSFIAFSGLLGVFLS